MINRHDLDFSLFSNSKSRISRPKSANLDLRLKRIRIGVSVATGGTIAAVGVSAYRTQIFIHAYNLQMGSGSGQEYNSRAMASQSSAHICQHMDDPCMRIRHEKQISTKCRACHQNKKNMSKSTSTDTAGTIQVKIITMWCYDTRLSLTARA